MADWTTTDDDRPVHVLRRRRTWIAAGGVVLLALLSWSSCTKRDDALRDSAGGGDTGASDVQTGGVLFDYAVKTVFDLPDGYKESEKALEAVVARLNQWSVNADPPEDWHVDPLVDSLPKELRSLVSESTLASMTFLPFDGKELRQNVWLKSIGQAAGAQEGSELARAERLFDWTIRNVQLTPDSNAAVAHDPAEILLLGRGTAEDRAWIFTLLARQQGIDVVLLAKQPADAKDQPKPLLAGVLLEDQIYVFDPELGLPIPGPDGAGVATLAQIAGDDALLRKLDLDAEHPYPLTAGEAQRMIALLEASPTYLSRRMQAVQANMSGERQLVLSFRPTSVAERLKASPQIASSKLWTLPYDRVRARSKMNPKQMQSLNQQMVRFIVPPDELLWKGRVLQLLGKYTGTDPDFGAVYYFNLARPSKNQIDRSEEFALQSKKPETRAVDITGHFDQVRAAKEDATYWLGLVNYALEHYPTSVDYLDVRTLQAAPTGPWTGGATYNLARAYEAMNQPGKAVELYETDTSPQRHGNLLRARWLQERDKKAAP